MKKLSIITPCSRQNNIPKLFDTINFEKIHQWIIVYDTSKDRKYNKMYENNSKIMELECDNVGVAGHPQRNYGTKFVDDGYIYFLDDDNIIHPQFWSVVDMLDNERFYTFNQERNKDGTILYGNNIAVYNIDTAMFIIHKKHIGDIKWISDKYEADGYFICDINKNNEGKHVFVNLTACYYNYLC